VPHVDRLFRQAMWIERDRREPEDLVQEVPAAGRSIRRPVHLLSATPVIEKVDVLASTPPR
jgi:hypothetical protein